MLNKKNFVAGGSSNIGTVIGRDSKFTGKLNTEGSLRIDGLFEGEIESNGDLIIGESGQVEASIIARNLTVSGVLKGNVRLTGRLEIAPKGQVIGDVEVGQLVVEPGGILLGNCRMPSETREKNSKPGSVPGPKGASSDLKKDF